MLARFENVVFVIVDGHFRHMNGHPNTASHLILKMLELNRSSSRNFVKSKCTWSRCEETLVKRATDLLICSLILIRFQ